ncbi:hypothetical protein J2T57_001314 [Natronocella acetinitrilica]|uniref:Uncharacterized protein n=1 Tax=Natronocella acetinitrilica TaxID=414046 RepID=A0AAE3KFM2_9GAMM|nr:hypothetical protein [Natronocella acetinitrilica]MCP1674212.1 hypothetical protein [Natronocella acetinitrilica]
MITRIDRIRRALHVLDYVLAAAVIIYGMASGSALAFALGVAGLGLAYMRPANGVEALIRRRLGAR